MYCCRLFRATGAGCAYVGHFKRTSHPPAHWCIVPMVDHDTLRVMHDSCSTTRSCKVQKIAVNCAPELLYIVHTRCTVHCCQQICTGARNVLWGTLREYLRHFAHCVNASRVVMTCPVRTLVMSRTVAAVHGATV